MIRSMTGFGRGEYSNDQWEIKIELKSVNHRYLDLALRIPRSYSSLEEAIRNKLKESFARGRIEIYLSLEDLREKERMVKIDKPLLKGYLQALTEINQHLPKPQAITLEQVIGLPDLLQVDETTIDWDELTTCVLQALTVAIDGLQEMRTLEGSKLEQDILHKLDAVEHVIQRIQEKSPTVVVEHRKRLEERLAELVDGTSLSEERFEAEVAVFADRCSIDEEIVRLHSHTQHFHQSIQKSGSIGRKLDFLLQEMNREMNTIGSKANDLEISRWVVEAKSELEKIREQVQNIE